MRACVRLDCVETVGSRKDDVSHLVTFESGAPGLRRDSWDLQWRIVDLDRHYCASFSPAVRDFVVRAATGITGTS